MVLTRNASAAAPIRVCRERRRPRPRPRRRRQLRQRQRRDRREGLRRRARRCAERAADALGLEAAQVAVAETGTIGVPLPIERRPARDRRGGREPLRRAAATTFSEAIMTTDRWPKRCTLRAGGVTLSAQAKGAGMIEPNMATMLCFVQTDAVVDRPRRGPARGRRRLLQPDHRRRPDEHQRLRPAAGDRRRRRAAAATACCEAVLTQLAIEIVRDGEGAARVGRIEVSEAAERGRGRAGRPGDRQLAAGEDGALRPRPQLGPDRPGGRRGAGRRGPRGDRRRLDRRRRARRREPRKPRSGCGSAAASGRAHVWFSDLGYEYVKINAEYTT